MNPSTLIGIVASVALLSVVMLFAAREPALFVDLPSLGIVVVGTLVAGVLLVRAGVDVTAPALRRSVATA